MNPQDQQPANSATSRAMSADAQRIAIAEACPELFAHVPSPFGPGATYWRTGVDDDGKPISPGSYVDPLSDLNAIHEAEKQLGKDKKEWFLIVLYCLVTGITVETKQPRHFALSPWMAFHVAHATAAQRAEAFLRTIGKWTEGEQGSEERAGQASVETPNP